LQLFYGIILEKIKKIIENYKLISNLPQATTTGVSSVCKVSEPDAAKILKEKELIDDLVQFKKTNQKKDDCHFAARILFPGEFSFKDILKEKEIDQLEVLKFNQAVHLLKQENLSKTEISEKLNTPLRRIEEIQSSGLIVYGEDTGSYLRRAAQVREFYGVYQNATLKEGAKALQMTNQELIDIIDDLRSCGEKIQLKRLPTEMERAQLSGKVVEMKSKDVSLSNRDIALQLDVPVSEVSKAIKKTLKDWQIERAENLDFYFKNTLSELHLIQDEAITRFKSSDRSSSRWLEIYLMASEKKIKMLGLNAPEKVDIQGNLYHATKEERDAVVAAYQATEIIEADFENVEITQEKKEELEQL